MGLESARRPIRKMGCRNTHGSHAMRRPAWMQTMLLLTTLSLSILARAKTPMRALILAHHPETHQDDMPVGGSCWFPPGRGSATSASTCARWDKCGSQT